ncbi:MAG TPA: penicillin-binding protein, partial [Sphingomonadaceae bacterium]|nr:penicillin-binding protein [Sphingomonadaceae bacterium]
PLFGKTGTTNGPTNAWFVGGTPDIVAGTYIGFDQPKNLGGYVQGGNTAAPIFKEFVQATRSHWSDRPFLAPPGIQMVRIDRRTGRQVYDAWPTNDPLAGVIWEAFRPDTEPRRGAGQDDINELRDLVIAQLRRREQAASSGVSAGAGDQPGNFAEEQGGIY